jgi:hypothetical protein
MSQHPKILSTEDLDTSEAKCVRNSHLQGHPSILPSLKVGKLEEDKLARPKGQKGEENSYPYLSICRSKCLLQRVWEAADRKTRGKSGVDGTRT